MQNKDSLKYLTDRFLNVEEKYNLFDLKIRNVEIWAYLRFNFFFKKIVLGGESQLYPIKKKKRICDKFSHFLQVINRSPFKNAKRVDLLVFSHPRRIKVGDYYEDIYIDKFVKKLHSTYCIIEPLYDHLIPNEIDELKYMDSIEYLVKLKNFFYRKLHPLKVKEINIVKKIIAIIKKEFNLCIDEKSLIHSILFTISYAKHMEYYLTKLIIATKPKAILETVYYDNLKLTINKTAAKLGVKTIEIQHGVISKYHIAYNFNKKNNFNWFPDEIWCFGQYYKDIMRIPIEKNSIEVIGFDYLNRMHKKYTTEQIITHDNKEIILFISQWAITDKILNLAINLNKVINKDKYKIVFKLHPREKSRFENHTNDYDGIEIISDEEHLYQLFAKSSFLVGVFSTAVFEGLKFGLKTFILKTTGYEYMEDMIKQEIVHLVENENQILDNLSKNEALDLKIIKYIWEEVNFNKINKLIDRI